jgi:hypothetical protein
MNLFFSKRLLFVAIDERVELLYCFLLVGTVALREVRYPVRITRAFLGGLKIPRGRTSGGWLFLGKCAFL